MTRAFTRAQAGFYSLAKNQTDHIYQILGIIRSPSLPQQGTDGGSGVPRPSCREQGGTETSQVRTGQPRPCCPHGSVGFVVVTRNLTNVGVTPLLGLMNEPFKKRPCLKPGGEACQVPVVIILSSRSGISGAATRAAGLSAVAVPVRLDQPFRASRLTALGVAAGPLPYQRLTASWPRRHDPPGHRRPGPPRPHRGGRRTHRGGGRGGQRDRGSGAAGRRRRVLVMSTP